MATPWKKYLPRLASICLIVLVAGCALWPVESEGEVGTPQDALTCNRELSRLARAASAGQAATATLTEKQLNAHLSRLLAHNPRAQQTRGLGVGLEQLRLATDDGELSFYLRGRVGQVPFQIELEIEECGADLPCARSDETVWLGKLRLLPPLKTLALWRLNKIMRQLNQEKAVLHHLQELQIQGDQIVIRVAGEGQDHA